MLILNRIRNVIYLLCTAFLLLCFQSAQAAPSAGITVSAKGRVTSTSPGQRAVQLKRRSPFGRSDTLATGAASRGIFKFKDGTVFRLNSKSKVVVNQYRYNPKSKRGKLNIRISNNSNVLYISGKMPKSNVRIKTSLGILGLRGSSFNVSRKNGITVLFGAVKVVSGTVTSGTSIINAGQTLSITGTIITTPPSLQAALMKEANQVAAEAGVPPSGSSGGESSSDNSAATVLSAQAAAGTASNAVKTITIEITPEE